MLETPEVKELPRRLCAYIPVRVPRAEIQRVMGPGIHELMDELRAQGVAPAGAWFTHHPRLEPSFFDFEISVPVNTPVRPHGRVQPGEWPAMRAAVAIHPGPYEQLVAAWGDFKVWMAQAGVTPGPSGLWECYLVGPETGQAPAGYRTQLVQPVL